MGVTNSNKVLDRQKMTCCGTAKVTLALTAAPDILTNPTDIALVLDRSGSMQGATLESMKTGAKTFIDIIEEATGGAGSGQIGSGSRIGIVSFSDTAVANTQLITSTQSLKDAVDSLTAAGSTNHAAAFAAAGDLFDYSSGNARVLVLFTDGKTTSGEPPAPVAAGVRAKGVTIYCIGLLGTDGIDVASLNQWASDPDSAHVAVTPTAADLEKLFAELARNISKTGATDIVIREVLEEDFAIINVLPPNRGTAETLDDRSLCWRIPELGVSGSESAVLEFWIRHTGDDPGVKPVNLSITYTDREGNAVTFPQPAVAVECSYIVQPEKCPEPVSFTVDGCEDSVVLDMGDVLQEGLGRILQLDVTVKNVCPGRRVALAAILTELDEAGNEYPRGMKTYTLPAHSGPGCRDVQVRCIPFVVPEDLRPGAGPGASLCARRRFKVRFIANSIDTDFRCCSTK